MDDDLSARRAERLSPAGQELLDEIRELLDAADNQAAIPSLLERIRDLPQGEQREIGEILGLEAQGYAAEGARLQRVAEAAEEAERVIRAAQEKLRAEGKPVDPNMTAGEAIEILAKPG
jgi:hypothetical protein